MVPTPVMKRFFTSALTFAFLTTSLTPVSARLFSSKPDKESLSASSPNREAQIDAYNEQAIRLFEEGRFKDAQELWEQAIDLMERPETYVERYQEGQEMRQPAEEEFVSVEDGDGFGAGDVDDLYETAVSLFKRQKYVASKKLFERVESVIPDHKASRNYLAILEHKLKQAQQSLIGDKFKENALSRREERAQWREILEESERELERKLREQAEPVYQQALQYYKSRAFKPAKDCFGEVERILPGYKDTGRYLARIDNDIRQEAQRLMEERRRKEALARQKEKEEWQRILLESEQELQKKLAEQAESVYQEAVNYYKQRQFELAKSRFQEVEWILPGYKSTAKYLARIDQDVQEEFRMRQQQRARELERRKREEEIARKREEERLEKRREAEEQERLRRFQEEVAARRKEREEWLKILEESERERQRKLQEQAGLVYREAVRFYKERQLEQAKENFQEVERILPDYKSTVKYLARIDQDIKEEEERRLAERQRAFQRELREKKLADRRKLEEERQRRAVEEQNRLREFQEKALAREKQREEWDRVLRENASERRRKLEEEAGFVYEEAVRAYKERHWERARNGFLEAGRILPGYKPTEKYLARIDRNMRREEQKRRETAKEAAERQKREETLAAEREEARQRKLREAEEREQIQQRRRQAAAVYRFAVSLYKRGNYAQAKDKFLEAEQIFPGYTAAAKYLRRIDGDIAKDQERRQQSHQIAFERQIKEQRLSRKREEERTGRLREAEEKQRIQKLSEEALARRKEREEWEKTVRQIEAEHQKRLRRQADSIYKEALRYYEAGWFKQAKETFEEVEAMVPGYKSAGKYLAKMEQSIRKEERFLRESEKKIREREEEILTKKDRGAEDRELQIKAAAGKLYKEALRAYKQRDYVRAKEKFHDVAGVFPDYKSTEKFLGRIEGDIARAEERRRRKAEAALRRQVREERLAKRREEANRKKLRRLEERQKIAALRAEADARRREKESLKASLDKMERERRKKLEEQAAPIYKEAVRHYRAEAFQQAKEAFMEVEKIAPAYKSTARYLSRIDEEIAREAKRRRVRERRAVARQEKEEKPAEERIAQGPVESPGTPLTGDNNQPESERMEESIRGALSLEESRFQEPPQQAAAIPSARVQGKEPRRGKAGDERAELERFVQKRRKELQAKRRAVQREYEKQFQRLYARAVKLYRRGSYEEAGGLFFEIERMKPGYKKAAAYLEKAQAKIKKDLPKRDGSVVLRPQETKTRSEIVNEALDALERKL